MPVSKLILGTAQFDMSYGVTNQSGRINKTQIEKILEYENYNNITILDAARFIVKVGYQ
jgi:hypothetical protein|tara:strand:+ start:1707 stop:1883 length:177 start_codon:yes stop_codon:yes gene_type:complete